MIRKLIHRINRQSRLRADPIGYARSIGVRVGSDCRFLGTSAGTFGSEPYLISIGDHVTITGGVRFVTHDGGVWVLRQEMPDIDVVAPISVGNNVFIGLNSIVMPGVTIGNNCVIGAGSVVTRDIPDNSIAAGMPAKVVTTYSAYKEKSVAKGLFIREMSPEEKRRFLEDRFVRGMK
jgi:acetyltransferase-like isoleucine patch superfamily enzyme